MSIHKRLRVIADATGRSVLAPAPELGDKPVIQGDDNRSTISRCGKCDRVLVRDVPEANVQNIVIKCPTCSALNELGGRPKN